MTNGQIVTGANQENASFPAGLCAERVLLAAASSLYPGMPIDTLAVSYDNEQGPSDRPISPCGICRQSLQEFEQSTGRPVRLIMGGQDGKIYPSSPRPAYCYRLRLLPMNWVESQGGQGDREDWRDGCSGTDEERDEVGREE